MSENAMERTAIISPCERFRYALTRRWTDGPIALFIMLNPSDADAYIDDPTIRRCIGFAKRENCGGLRVENLFAYRSPKPNIMFREAHSAIGDADRLWRIIEGHIRRPKDFYLKANAIGEYAGIA